MSDNFKNVTMVHFPIDSDFLIHEIKGNPTAGAKSSPNHEQLRILVVADDCTSAPQWTVRCLYRQFFPSLVYVVAK